jgi:hypothetical protein
MIEATGTPRRTIASFERYEEAAALVDRLAAQGFPVERLVIVGRDLELVEQVTDRVTPGRVAAEGMGSGAVLGAVFGLLFGAVFPGVPALAEFLYWLAVGAAAGLLAAAWYFLRGTPRFKSVAEMRASRYEVMADETVADDALRRLGARPAETLGPVV